MQRARLSLVASMVVVVAFVASCTDRRGPTEPIAGRAQPANSVASEACRSLDAMETLTRTVWGDRTQGGSPDVRSALGKLETIDKLLRPNNGAPKTAEAQANARSLIDFIGKKWTGFPNPGRGLVPDLIAAIECFASLPHQTELVSPGDGAKTIVNGSGQAGVQLPADAVSEPTLISVTMLDPATPPLDTKLDQYPGYVDISQYSNVTNSLRKEVIVAVCPVTSVPTTVRDRLRLGHQSTTAGFQITPPASGAFLTCTGVASAANRFPGWIRSLASLVLPKPLYARRRDLGGGGVGGTATEFSPFGPVDPVLSLDGGGGAGGTATEFQRAPESSGTANGSSTATEGTKQSAHILNSSEAAVRFANATTCDEAAVGSDVPKNCRPVVTIHTYRGNPLKNVPVGWAIGLGEGRVATDNPAGAASDCGPFGNTASGTTNVNGHAQACWTLGKAGANTVVATPSAGGDAPAGVTFSPATYLFAMNAVKLAATITLGNLSQVYDGAEKSVTIATNPPQLETVSVTYNGSPAKPTDAGSYAVVATLTNASYEGTATGTLVIGQAGQTIAFSPLGPRTYGDPDVSLIASGGGSGQPVTFSAAGNCTVSGDAVTLTGAGSCTVTASQAGDANYTAATPVSRTFTIAKSSSTTVLSCPVSVTYDGSARTPCTASVTGAGGLNEKAAPSYSDNTNAGTATASYTFAGNANHEGSSGSATFTIAKAPVTATAGSGGGEYNGQPFAASPCVVSGTYTGDLTCANDRTGGPDVETYPVNPVVSGTGLVNFEITSRAGAIVITKAPSTIAMTCSDVTYNGTAQTPCSATATGAGGLNVALSPGYANNTNAGTATATAAYGGDKNHTAALDVAKTFNIAKAPSSTVVTCSNGTYTGSALTLCTAIATGAGGLSIELMPVYANNTNAGTATATATYAGDENHYGSSTSTPFTIAKAPSTTALTCNSVTYNGSALTPCTASVTGAGTVVGIPSIAYTNNRLAGTATATATYPGDNNHFSSSASATFTILTHVTGAFVNTTASAIAKGANSKSKQPIHFSVVPANGGSIAGLWFTLTINAPTPVTVASKDFKLDAATSTYLWNSWDIGASGGVAGSSYTVTITFDDGTALKGIIAVTK